MRHLSTCKAFAKAATLHGLLRAGVTVSNENVETIGRSAAREVSDGWY
jgi:hypothetical protein